MPSSPKPRRQAREPHFLIFGKSANMSFPTLSWIQNILFHWQKYPRGCGVTVPVNGNTLIVHPPCPAFMYVWGLRFLLDFLVFLTTQHWVGTLLCYLGIVYLSFEVFSKYCLLCNTISATIWVRISLSIRLQGWIPLPSPIVIISDWAFEMHLAAAITFIPPLSSQCMIAIYCITTLSLSVCERGAFGFGAAGKYGEQ